MPDTTTIIADTNNIVRMVLREILVILKQYSDLTYQKYEASKGGIVKKLYGLSNQKNRKIMLGNNKYSIVTILKVRMFISVY